MTPEQRTAIIDDMVNHMAQTGGSIGVEENDAGYSEFDVNGAKVTATSEEVGDMVLDAIDLYADGNVA